METMTSQWGGVGNGAILKFCGEEWIYKLSSFTCERSPCKLLHSPSLLAVKLSLKYEIWTPIGGHRPSWLHGLHVGSDCLSRNGFWAHVTGGNFHRFQRRESHCTTLTTGKCLSLGLCNETVRESTVHDTYVHVMSGRHRRHPVC